MKLELTQEQQTAVDAPVGENLVSAAAGSGKTKVLSERIVKRIKSGDTSIDRLLIVTFTRAAAMQMRERIYKALEEAVKEEEREDLKRQLSFVSSADICTIDSFCIDLVKKNFFRVEVPSDFSIADPAQMDILKEEVLIEVLDELFEKGEEDFINLATTTGKGKNDSSLKEMILSLYTAAMTYANPEAWLDKAVKMHEKGSKENNELFDFLKKEAEDEFEDMLSLLKHGCEEAVTRGIPEYHEVFQEELDSIQDYLDRDIEQKVHFVEFGAFKRTKGEEFLQMDKDYLKSVHEQAKKLLEKIKDLCTLLNSERGVTHEKVSALTKAVKLFKKRFMEEKLLRKELEFADCEYYAIRILTEDGSSEVVEELRNKYDEIYIDEYQDTNPLQDTLFEIISRKERGEGNVFIVGDVKQSIYRFRHSDPTLFTKKAELFDKSEKGNKMILSKNFRSRRDVLNSVNNVFENIMRKSTAQVEYDEEHRLNYGAASYVEYNKDKSEIYVLQKDYDSEFDDEELMSEHKEAMVVARKIKEMMDEGFMVTGKDGMRKLKYSDIAILSPVIKGKVDMFKSIFDLMDIPVFCEAGRNFFDTIEIKTMLSLLTVIDNPLNDIPLAATMRSPVFSFSENELLEIRVPDRKVPLYENVIQMAENDSPLGKKCNDFLQTLEQWRELSFVMSVEKFVQKILTESTYYSFVGALPGGKARQENLISLMDMAQRFENKAFKGLYNFVKYIEKNAQRGSEIEIDMEQSDEAVLITSIHKSKGLEFPVVFLMGCGKQFNDSDSYGNMIYTSSGAVGLLNLKPETRVRYKCGEYTAISLMVTRENHAEKQRLLYVAMTRAKEKLILVGTVTNLSKKLDEWASYNGGRGLSDYRIRSFKNFLDYVCPVADPLFWDTHFVHELPALLGKKEEETAKEEKALTAGVKERLSYLYPYANLKNIPSKMSVSEIKKLSMENEMGVDFYKPADESLIPSFLKKKEALSGAKRGTAYHRVMELIDLNEKNVKKAIEGFVENGLMDKEEGECIDIKKVEAFLSSPLAEKMRNAKRIWKEESFTITIDAKDVFEEGGDEKICVQGTIDCFFEDCNSNLVLLDYKTDYYQDPEEIGKKYKKQLELYELAIFMKFSQKCNEKCLYLFHNDDIINV